MACVVAFEALLVGHEWHMSRGREDVMKRMKEDRGGSGKGEIGRGEGEREREW